MLSTELKKDGGGIDKNAGACYNENKKTEYRKNGYSVGKDESYASCFDYR